MVLCPFCFHPPTIMWPLRIREGVKEHCTTKIEKVISILLMKSRPNRVTTAVTVQVIVGVGYSKAQKVIFTWHTPSGQNNMPFGTTKHKQNDFKKKKIFQPLPGQKMAKIRDFAENRHQLLLLAPSCSVYVNYIYARWFLLIL